MIDAVVERVPGFYVNAPRRNVVVFIGYLLALLLTVGVVRTALELLGVTATLAAAVGGGQS